MEDKICIDTDILADFLRNKNYAIEWMLKNKDKILATTAINLFELYYGANISQNFERSIDAINKLKERLLILSFDDNFSNKAAALLSQLEKDGNVIGLKDIFIGSISLANDFSFKTNNLKHFERINGLKLI